MRKTKSLTKAWKPQHYINFSIRLLLRTFIRLSDLLMTFFKLLMHVMELAGEVSVF